MNIRFLHFLFLVFVLTKPQVGLADKPKQALMLELRDGSRVAYYLESRPKVTFSGSDLCLSTFDVEVSYPFSEVRKYTFEMADPSSVSAHSGGSSAVRVLSDGVQFSGLSSGAEVSVYAADGRRVLVRRAGSDGNCSVSLAIMPAGVYVIQYGKSNLKIMKR